MADLIDRQAVQEMVDRIGGMYPYRQIGNRDSYSQYNEAWTDAINRVDAELNSLPSAQPVEKDINVPCKDTISRQDAIDALDNIKIPRNASWYPYYQQALTAMSRLPSAQPERDIPIKPIETTDKAWGIPHRQAVCPKCNYYLGHVAFLGDYKGKHITYCETCGQAIDWEGWVFDE